MSKLPFVSSDIPRDLRQFINSVREAIGGTGDTKIVTVGDLVRSGIATTKDGGVITPPVGTVDPPTTPTNVTASGAIQNIIVTWDAALYRGHSYAEIWGSATDNVGVAVKIGMSPGAIFVDAVGPSIVRYYWVRFVNSLGAIGAFNAVSGTQGQTGSDVDYLLGRLTGQITTSQLYTDLNTRINLIDGSGTGSVNARISTEATTRTNADTAIAQTVTTLSTTVGINTAAIQTEATTRSTQTGDLYAKYGVKVDLAGHVSGYGLLSTLNNGTPFSAFGIRADQFWIAPPSFVSATAPTTNLYNGYVWVDTSVTPNVTRYRNTTTNSWVTTAPNLPFIVQATPTTINGVAVAAGVYIDTAFIRDGTITNAKIGNATIDSAKIVSLSAAKITAGEIAVGQSIASTSFVSGTQGWRIQGNGTAEFAAASIRGQLTAAQIDTTNLTIKNAAGQVIFGAGTNLGVGYITGLGSLATQNSVSAGNVSGLGSLATQNTVGWSTQITGMPGFGNFAFANSITSANISTYIAGAAIGEAYIADLAVTSAKIRDGEVTNAKIGSYIASNTFNGTITNGSITANGTTGWAFDKAGTAVLNSLVVTSGNVTGVIQQIVPITLFYSGLAVGINGNNPSQSLYSGKVCNVNGQYCYEIWSGNMPAPGISSGHKTACAVSASILTGNRNSTDLTVFVLVYPLSYVSYDTGYPVKIVYQGENITNVGASGPYSISCTAAGASQNSYAIEVPIAVYVTGNILSGTIGNVSGVFWGVR